MLTASEGSVHDQVAPKQKHPDGRVWWSKAIPFVAAKKQSAGGSKRKGQGPDMVPETITP